MKYAALFVAVLVGMLGLAWIFQGNDFFLYKTFAPKYEAARRDTFEQSKAYNDGMAQELRSMQFQYEQADEAHKAALASVIRHRVAGYDSDRLPADLQAFVAQVNRGVP